MTTQPLNLTDHCPTWCQDHHYDDDAENVEHEAIVGVAGPLEVALQRFVLPHQADPVTELVIYHTGDTSGERTMAIPLDVATVDGLAGLLGRALLVARSEVGPRTP